MIGKITINVNEKLKENNMDHLLEQLQETGKISTSVLTDEELDLLLDLNFTLTSDKNYLIF